MAQTETDVQPIEYVPVYTQTFQPHTDDYVPSSEYITINTSEPPLPVASESPIYTVTTTVAALFFFFIVISIGIGIISFIKK